MKTLRRSDIESMKQELTVLVNPERFLGGSSDYDYSWIIEKFSDGSNYYQDSQGNIYIYVTLPEVVITGSTSIKISTTAEATWETEDSSSGITGNALPSLSTPCTCGACSNFDAMNNPHNANGADGSNLKVWNPIGELIFKMFVLKHDPCCAWSWK